MLHSFETSHCKFQFIEKSHLVNENDNVYTAIIGKNGTGKSRLLKSVIEELLNDNELSGRFEITEYRSRDRSFEGFLRLNKAPEKIIAVSTSPFDKFPLPKRHKPIEGYSYLGLRDLMSNSLGFAYMSKIINSLIKAIIDSPERANSIGHVLNYLGYSDEILARFHLSPTLSRMERFIYDESPEESFIQFLNSPSMRNIDRSFFFDVNGEVNFENVHETFRIFSGIQEFTSKPRFDVVIGRSGVDIVDSNYHVNNDFMFLVESGIAKLRDVGLQKNESRERFRISDASSGEQSVVMGLLGIASQVQDGSLVCIDEPEVCLHPEWQEKYMELLADTFRDYKNCQFLIATHSPQIVSNLPFENAFIMAMETGYCDHSTRYLHQSADFQLASIFKAPGYKNEYLNRVALNIFVKVGKNKKFDVSDVEMLSFLIENQGYFKKNEPLSELIEAIKEMHEKYG